jgi:hypothetical protein
MLTALLAIVFGVARLFGLTALGRALLRRRRAPWLTVPLAILAAGAALGAMYAVMLWVGWRDAALVIDAIATLLAVIARGRQTAIEIRRLFTPLIEVLWSDRRVLVIAIVITALLLFAAVMPPRDTDALRYHLAHIGQIDTERRWNAMSIAHYAFPFAWQFGFLPFVHFGLPEGAQVVDLGLWVVAIAALVAQRGRAHMGATSLLLIAMVTLSPMVVGMATTPTADGFTALSVLVVAFLLAGNTPDAGAVGVGDATALGFAAWVGVGTRYQAFAVGNAATIVALFWLSRADRWVTLLGFVEGAVLALLLASPFYLANAVRFGNPVWPLRSPSTGGADYVGRVGAFYSNSWHGTLSIPDVARAAYQLLVDRSTLPVPLLLIFVVASAFIARGPAAPPTRRVASFCLLFVAIWALAQPMLYPRFVIYLAGPVLLLALRHAGAVDASRFRLAARAILSLAVVALGGYAIAGTTYDLRLLASGGRTALRASTWYFPAYQWIGQNAAPSARVLAIVRSGETWYLPRRYRRADPGSSAEIDWPRMTDGVALGARLRSGHLDYVVYESNGWTRAPGGAAMVHAIDDAVARGVLVEQRRFELRLTRHRFRDVASPSTVIVYRVAPSPG